MYAMLGQWQEQTCNAKRTVLILCALCALVLTGCSITTPIVIRNLRTANSSGATSVHILRTSEFPQNHIPPLDRTVTDQAQTKDLYDALRALPAPPSDSYVCPADFGEAYYLTFYRNKQEVFW